MGRKLGAVLLSGQGSCDPIKPNVTWANVYLHTKWHLSPSSRLATMDIGRKLVGSALLGEGELGPHLTQCLLG